MHKVVMCLWWNTYKLWLSVMSSTASGGHCFFCSNSDMMTQRGQWCWLFVFFRWTKMLRPCRLLLWQVVLRLSYHVVTGKTQCVCVCVFLNVTCFIPQITSSFRLFVAFCEKKDMINRKQSDLMLLLWLCSSYSSDIKVPASVIRVPHCNLDCIHASFQSIHIRHNAL